MTIFCWDIRRVRSFERQLDAEVSSARFQARERLMRSLGWIPYTELRPPGDMRVDLMNPAWSKPKRMYPRELDPLMNIANLFWKEVSQ